MPDFVKLADAYGWAAERVERPADVAGAIERMLAAPGPYLLDVAISPEQNVYPMVAPGAGLDDIMGAIDVAVGAVRTAMPGVADAPASSPCAQIDAQFGGRWESGPEDTGARLGQDGSPAAGDWRSHVRAQAGGKGGAS